MTRLVARTRKAVRSQGTRGFAHAMADRAFRRTSKLAPTAVQLAAGSEHALEVGGPSRRFMAGHILASWSAPRSRPAGRDGSAGLGSLQWRLRF